MFKAALLPVVAWAGALQSMIAAQRLTAFAQVIGAAGVLGALTVLVYRLGVWRQEMENTKHNVGAELRRYRAETAENFDRMARHLEAIDHLMTVSAEHRERVARWQQRTEKRLARLEAE